MDLEIHAKPTYSPARSRLTRSGSKTTSQAVTVRWIQEQDAITHRSRVTIRQ